MVLQLPSPTPPIHQLSKGDFTWRAPAAQCPICLQGLNAALYYRNTDFREYVSLVPTSAHTGEGVPDILMLVVQLTQKLMLERQYIQEIRDDNMMIRATELLPMALSFDEAAEREYVNVEQQAFLFD